MTVGSSYDLRGMTATTGTRSKSIPAGLTRPRADDYFLNYGMTPAAALMASSWQDEGANDPSMTRVPGTPSSGSEVEVFVKPPRRK